MAPATDVHVSKMPWFFGREASGGKLNMCNSLERIARCFRLEVCAEVPLPPSRYSILEALSSQCLRSSCNIYEMF